MGRWTDPNASPKKPLLLGLRSSRTGPARYAQVAQSVEQRIENPRVGGSIPPLGTTPRNFTSDGGAIQKQSVPMQFGNISPVTASRCFRRER
jgi:hypothetical protein